MSGGGKDVLTVPGPSGPGRGRPKKARPRENEAGSGPGIGAEVKRRRKSCTAVGETGELEFRTTGTADESETNVVELMDPDPPVTRSGARSEKHPMNKGKQNAVKGAGSVGEIGSVNELDSEGESHEEEKDNALGVVLKVHGVSAQGTERAAAFPGETGEEIEGHVHLSACCMRPEVLKQTLVCDGCERSFHLTCLKLALQSASEFDDWICTSCSAAYPELEVAAGVSKAVRQDIERKLFSQEMKTCGDEGVQNKLRGTVRSRLDDDQSMADMTASSEQSPQEPNQANVTGDGDHRRQDYSGPSVLPGKALLDLNETNDGAVDEGSFRKDLGIDLNESRTPDFEEEVLKVDKSSTLPEVEGVIADATVLPHNGQSCTNSTESNPKQSASKATLSSERVHLPTAEESTGVSNFVFSAAAGNIAAEFPPNVGESCVEEIIHPSIAEATSRNEVKLPDTLEECTVTNATRSTLFSAELTVGNEKKLAATSLAEEPTTVADGKLPVSSEESDFCYKNRPANFSPVLTDRYEEKRAGHSVGGELTPVVEMKALGNPQEREDLNTSRSTISSAEHAAVKQACSLVVATDTDSIADESVRLMSADSQKAGGVDARLNDKLREATDLERCITAEHLGQDGEVGTTKHSESSEKRARKNGSKLLEHFQGEVVTEPSITGERMEVSELELASHNALPPLPVVATSPTSSADVLGMQPEWQRSKIAANKIASPVSHADRASCSSDGLNGPVAGKSRDENSPSGPDDLQLKKVGADTLQQLRDSLREKHGLMLADGWEVEVRRRRTEKHLDKYYISPEKHRFRSRVEVMKHLGLWDGSKCSSGDGSKGRCEAQQPHPKEWLTMVRGVARGNDELQLPLKLGELTIESLGVIDVRPGYWDELHIWPVGYRCTWHDRTTSSFCVSEVADGGLAPIFRVTRKYCPEIVGLADTIGEAVAENNGSSEMAIKGLRTSREDITAASVDKMSSCSRGVKSQYGSGVDVEEEESLKALLGDIGSSSSSVHYENVNLNRDSRNLDETSKTGSEDYDGSRSPDVIGEFCVEASSTVEVWKLYAMQFVERCWKVSDVFESVVKTCPHKTTATVGSLSKEIPDPKDFLVKLGEDRFGLNQTMVIGLIETLPNSQKCSSYKSLKQRGLSWKAADPVEGTVQPARFRIREKARKQKRTSGVQVEERFIASEPFEENDKDEVEVPVPAGERPPPPPGQSLGLRLPAQYVGDVLQIWEFLSRFSNLIGFSQPPALEHLEEGLTCGSATVNGCVNQSDSVHTGSEIRALKKVESGGKCDAAPDAEVSHAAPKSTTCEATGSPQTPMKTLLPGRTQISSSMHGSQQKDAGRMERVWENEGKVVGSPSNDTNPLMDIGPNHTKGETFSADAYPKSSEAKLMDETGLVSAASVHVPLIKFLISDLQSKVCGSEELPGESEESKHKRGRKRIRDVVANASLGREKLVGSFSINELTWPEVARRYIISLSGISKIGETAEYRREECMKVLRCIQGDGGVLCGALDGVAGMEIDAQLLAEAEKEISRLMLASEDTAAPATPPQSSSARNPVEDARGQDSSGECALWVKLLDPIAKLPTNVGSRIRNRVIDALAANPPAWAVEMLEYSISKKVYKGNASGPTKRAVMEVLQRYRGEEPAPKVKKTKKQRKRVLPSPEVVMQRCRIVLRQVATADTLRVVSKSYKCITHFYESEGEGLLARPLDFRAIDLRLGAGAYGTSPDAFAADMKQIWKNVASLNEGGNVESSAAIQLSELFNNLYNKQVIMFQRGGDQAAAAGPEGPNVKSDGLPNEESQKNVAEEKPLGCNANKPVKAPWEDDSCQVCAIDDDHDNVLLCDGCDAEYHIYCLNPPLPEVPDGNWFCHSCVAVDTGFLEAPPAQETATETKAPDKQDDHHHMRGHYLEEIAEKDQLRKSDESTHSFLRAIVLKLAETDYWHLTLAERVHLLKWLCDQALGTYKVRSHLEKSMEVALDLQQKLRTLLAERRRNADLDEARPDSAKEATREVSILSVLQSRGAVSRRTDEFDAETPVQVDVVDCLSVPEPSNAAVGTSTVVQSDPAEFVWAEGDAAMRTGVGTLRESSFRLVSADHSEAEQDKKDVSADQTRHDPVSDPMDVDLPNYSHTRDLGQSREGCGEGTLISNGEGNFESDDVKVLDTAYVLVAERSGEKTESPVRANPLIAVEPVNLLASFDGGLESTRKCPEDEPSVSPEVEVDTENNTLQRNVSNHLDAEIEKIKTKLMLLNSRRDLLGRDDVGRMYWALCGSKTTPWLAVQTVDANNPCQPEDQTGLAATAVFLPVDSSTLSSSVSKLEYDDVARVGECTNPADDVHKKEEVDGPANEAPRQPRDEFSWFIYSNEAVLDQLIGWLSPTSSQEKLLKAALHQWKSLLLVQRGTGAEQEGGLREDFFARFGNDGFRTRSTQAPASQDPHESRRCVMPVLKASFLIEWRYGQFRESAVKVSSTSGGSKRGRKRKMQETSEISRCGCLEPLWASRCHCMLCHTTYESEVELQTHTSGGSCSNAGIKVLNQQGDARPGKKPCHNPKPLSWTKSFKSALPQQSFPAILALPDVSRMPMIVHESLRDRIDRIGCIAEKGPLFAPGLAVSPAFDPALMMVDSSTIPSSVNSGGLISDAGILGTVAVGATSWISPGEGEDLVNGCRILVSSSQNLPGGPTAEAERAQSATDHTSGRSSAPIPRSPVAERAGPLDLKGLTTKEEVQFVHRQPTVPASGVGNTLPGPCDLPHELNGHPSLYKRYSKNFKVTGKQLTIPESSLCPLGAEEDLDMLQQIKVKLLDIEAAVTPDMHEKARAYPRRRQAWRCMLKFATSIYTVVQAIILLEQMICADFLRASWCYWSSFTVAAKTATLSSLFLRVYALDAAIAYEKSENYAGADITNCESKQGRQEKEREDKKHCPPIKPSRKKKKEEVIVIS